MTYISFAFVLISTQFVSLLVEAYSSALVLSLVNSARRLFRLNDKRVCIEAIMNSITKP